MKFFYRKFIIIIAGLAVLSMPLFVSAATADQLQQQKTTAAQQKAAAQQQAAQKQKEADYLNGQVSSIEKQINETQRSINETSSQVAATQVKIEELQNQIKIQEDFLAVENEKMGKLIASWYMEGDDSSLSTAILSSNSLSEVVTKQEYYDSIKQQIESTIEKINQIKAELTKQKTDQDAKIAELKKLQETQELQKTGLENQQWVKNRLLKDTTAMISQLKEQEKKAAAAEKTAEAQISALLAANGSQFGAGSGQRVNQGDTIGYEGSTGYSTGPHVHFMVFTGGNLANNSNPTNYLGGTLGWPLRNYRVTQSYGWTDYAAAGAYGGAIHNGIDVTDGLGAPVLAAAPGVVMLHQYFGGYGNAVVIQHDNGLWTLYGHMIN